MATKSKPKIIPTSEAKSISVPTPEPELIPVYKPQPQPEPEPEYCTVIITKTCRDSIMRYHKGKSYQVTPELRGAMLKAGVARDELSAS